MGGLECYYHRSTRNFSEGIIPCLSVASVAKKEVLDQFENWSGVLPLPLVATLLPL